VITCLALYWQGFFNSRIGSIHFTIPSINTGTGGIGISFSNPSKSHPHFYKGHAGAFCG
jgi:hypothetical protein